MIDRSCHWYLWRGGNIGLNHDRLNRHHSGKNHSRKKLSNVPKEIPNVLSIVNRFTGCLLAQYTFIPFHHDSPRQMSANQLRLILSVWWSICLLYLNYHFYHILGILCYGFSGNVFFVFRMKLFSFYFMSLRFSYFIVSQKSWKFLHPSY